MGVTRHHLLKMPYRTYRLPPCALERQNVLDIVYDVICEAGVNLLDGEVKYCVSKNPAKRINLPKGA